jgi:3-oxoisoapionate kinase
MIKPVLSFYGDDFTGSTDVMEALASNGIPTVLFTGIPGAEMLARFANCRAIGIAGASRSETPEWMENNLTPVFEWLKAIGADYCHYKVCSTFDSSPAIGSIGRAIEIGKKVFAQPYVPLIVGAPQLKRYTAFGHLFAAYQGENCRIDRHPVMSRHPVTPMRESDLRLHLAQQSALNTDLVDLSMLQSPHSAEKTDAAASACGGILLLDVAGPDSQLLAGQALARLKQAGGWFAAGSSGVEYALLAHWRHVGLLPHKPLFPSPGNAERIAIVSGSVSPTTERQIRHAAHNGFTALPVDPLALAGAGNDGAIEKTVSAGLKILREGGSPLIHTALGPSQDVGARLAGSSDARHKIGQALGRILRQLVERENLTRAVIAGGDTSSHALKELGIEALTTLMPLPETPGSPLCMAHGGVKPADGLQIALKGGQVGGDNYFSMIRQGG